MTAAAELSLPFESRFLRVYSRSKLRTDPVYNAVYEVLPDVPLLDLGCGIGLLSFYLRNRGFRSDILSIDHDVRKISAASRLGASFPGLTFRSGDIRDPVEFQGSVAMIDLLHYFDDTTQRRLLANAIGSLSSGGVIVIRETLKDDSLRYRLTFLQETLSRVIRWLRAERLNFPRRDLFESAGSGLELTVTPMWGRTPFNNYLFVIRRSGSGSTQASPRA